MAIASSVTMITIPTDNSSYHSVVNARNTHMGDYESYPAEDSYVEAMACAEDV